MALAKAALVLALGEKRMIDLGAAFADYQPQLLRWIRRRVPDDAEDICSQVFLEAVRCADTYDDRGYSLSAWLYTIARSRVVDETRRNARRPMAPLLDWPVAISGPEEQATRADYHRWIRDQIVLHLTDGQRRVIWLRFVADLSIAETAERLGMTIGQVKALQRRGIARLGRVFAPDGISLLSSRPSVNRADGPR